MIAVQGPRVIDQIARFSNEVPELKRYSFCEKSLLVVKLIISRTGYTGEDGVEVIMPARMTDMIVKTMLKQGGDEAQEVLKPAGLGAHWVRREKLRKSLQAEGLFAAERTGYQASDGINDNHGRQFPAGEHIVTN